MIREKPIHWIGTSHDDITALPKAVRSSFGVRLGVLQQGAMPLDTKALTQFGSGVFELRERYEKNAFRLVYVLKLTKAIYVLHVLIKKSKSGIGLPKMDADLIVQRLRKARLIDAED